MFCTVDYQIEVLFQKVKQGIMAGEQFKRKVTTLLNDVTHQAKTSNSHSVLRHSYKHHCPVTYILRLIEEISSDIHGEFAEKGSTSMDFEFAFESSTQDSVKIASLNMIKDQIHDMNFKNDEMSISLFISSKACLAQISDSPKLEGTPIKLKSGKTRGRSNAGEVAQEA